MICNICKGKKMGIVCACEEDNLEDISSELARICQKVEAYTKGRCLLTCSIVRPSETSVCETISKIAVSDKIQPAELYEMVFHAFGAAYNSLTERGDERPL
jgi:hypothetical protein